FLYVNNGDGTFTKVTTGPPVSDGGYSRGASWGDYDNDGDLDLFVTNSGKNNFLYANNGDGTFAKVTSGPPVSDGGLSYGAAWGDYDNDGDLDLFVANSEGENNFLYANNGSANHWINLQLVGTRSNISAIGAKVHLKAIIGGVPIWQLNEISGQSGFCGQNSLNAEFGLGDATVIDSIRIEWPSGIVWDTTNVGVDQFLTITEPVQIPTTGLVAHYPFNGNANDESGNGNDGTVYGATLGADRFGKPDSAYSFDGVDDNMNLGSGINLADSSFTFSFWDKEEDLEGGIIFSQGYFATNKHLHIQYSGGKFGIRFYNNDLNTTETFPDTINWQHWVCTFNASTKERKIYLNGQVVAEDIASANYSGSGNLYLGSRFDGGEHYPGNIDDIRIYSRALTEAEIQALYHEGGWDVEDNTPPAAPVGLAAIGEYYQVRLRWSPNEEADLAHYVVYQSLVSGFTPTGADSVAVTNAPDTTVVIFGLSAGPIYYFRIAARDQAGNLSPPSAEAMAITPASQDATGSSLQLVAGDGEVDFAGTDLILAFTFTSQTGADTIHVTRFGADPGGTPPSGVTIISTVYWEAIHNGSGTFSADMTFCLGPGTFTKGEQQYPARLCLLQRDTGGTLPWEIESYGASATDSTVTFTGITGLSQFAIGRLSDAAGPTISDMMIDPASPNQGEPVTVTATITDASAIQAVSLHYAKGGSAEYSGVSMSSLGGDTYQGIIPGTDVTAAGVAYFIAAEDNLGNKDISDVASIQVQYPAGTIHSNVPRSAFPDGFPFNRWRLVSLPSDVDDKSVTGTIREAMETDSSDKTWKLFRYEGPGPDDYMEAHSLALGESYFLKQIVFEEPFHFYLGAGQSVDLTGYTWTLQPRRWRFIASPYPFPVEVSADQGLFIGPYTYGEFGSGGQEGWSTGQVQETFEPWGGYIIYNNTDQTQTLGVKPASMAKTILAKEGADQSDGWLVQLTVEGERFYDGGNTIGRLPDAREGRDDFDTPEPPLLEECIALTMERSDWAGGSPLFTSDIRSLEEVNGIWDLDLHTRGETGPVAITYEFQGEVPLDIRVVFLDLVRRLICDLIAGQKMEPITGYNEKIPYHFKVIAGTPDYVQGTIAEALAQLPEEFALSQNYPNPFNPSTVIEYALPEPARVSLRVYNLLGREIVTLIDDWRDIGYHEVIWNGRERAGIPAASGIYFAVFQAEGILRTRKMVLLK
ncbi:MAG: LamG-like jellyroll fold domain-containing protein, partial [Candidatus Neomarinimicrobiota bacterium]